MGVFSEQVTTASKVPGKILKLEPSIFASDWAQRPTSPVVVGLRLLSEADVTTAVAEAVKEAEKLHPNGGDDFVDERNAQLLRWLVARGICDPNNVERPSEILPHAEDLVREALTSKGAKYIFEELERYQVEVSPIHRQAEDDDIAELVARLMAEDRFEEHGRSSEKMIRRFLAFILDEMKEHDPEDPINA